MAFLNIPNVIISGVSACVPKTIDDNNDYPLKEEDKIRLISAIGVNQKRIAGNKTTTSDLCYKAASNLIAELEWDKNEIDCLIFVSQTPDYILPATSCILQHRLGLSKECFTQDISLGCSGWLYGLSTISALVFAGGGSIRKALLLVGDTPSKTGSKEDKSVWPLFGDAGTATALEYAEREKGFKFHTASDGEGYDSIIIKDGGFRNMFSLKSLEKISYEEGISRSNLDCTLDGINVFSFAITEAPQSVNKLLKNYNIHKDSVDYFTFHQANLFLNETIRKILKIDKNKVPYSLKDFGNTSGASIVLTLVTELREELRTKELNHIACAFGVGLSWGTVYFCTNQIVCPQLIEY